MNNVKIIGNINDLLIQHGELNCEKAIESLNFLSPRNEFDISKINDVSNKIRVLLDADGNVLDEGKIRLAKYKIIPLGYLSKALQPICGLFSRTYFGTWKGLRTGTLQRLWEWSRSTTYSYNRSGTYAWPEELNNVNYLMRNLIDNNDKILAGISTYSDNLVVEQIEERLSDECVWIKDKRLSVREVVRCILARHENNKIKEFNNGFATSSDGTFDLINTGLLDKFLNYIYIVINNNLDGNDCNKIYLSKSNYTLQALGFSKEQVSLQPIRLYDTVADLVFNANEEEFDFSSGLRLNHILKDRLSRIDEEQFIFNPAYGASCIKRSISEAIKRNVSNYNYIKPCYYIKRNTINFVIPLLTDSDSDRSTKAALVIRKDDFSQAWVVPTVLDKIDAFRNCMVLSDVSGTWLDPQ